MRTYCLTAYYEDYDRKGRNKPYRKENTYISAARFEVATSESKWQGGDVIFYDEEDNIVFFMHPGCSGYVIEDITSRCYTYTKAISTEAFGERHFVGPHD